MPKRLWEGWKKLIHVVGAFQSRLLLSLFYFVIVMPDALFAKWTSDPLRLKRPTEGTNWEPWVARPATVEEATKQY